MVYQCYIGILAAVAYFWWPLWPQYGAALAFLVALTLIHLESTTLFSILYALADFTLDQHCVGIRATVALFWWPLWPRDRAALAFWLL